MHFVCIYVVRRKYLKFAASTVFGHGQIYALMTASYRAIYSTSTIYNEKQSMSSNVQCTTKVH